MKKPLILISLVAVTYYLYNGSNNSLEGVWTENGEKIVQSMIDGGKIVEGTIADNMRTVLNDATYTFSQGAVSISFKSDPTSNLAPVPYDVIEESKDSVAFLVGGAKGTGIKQVFFFTDDGQCIFNKAQQYNIYYCK